MKELTTFVGDDESPAFAVVCTTEGCGSTSSPRATRWDARDQAFTAEGFGIYCGKPRCQKCRLASIDMSYRVGWVGELCAKFGLEVPRPEQEVGPDSGPDSGPATDGPTEGPKPRRARARKKP